MATGKSGVTSSVLLTTYPAPTSTEPSEYDNLPPASPAVENSLEMNKNYKIIVTATLKEYKNNVWVNALKKNSTPVIQTVSKNFKTGPMTITAATSSAAKVSL